jgi:hypothetical protein
MYIAFVILASTLALLCVGAVVLHCHNSLAINQEMSQRSQLS